LYYVLQETTILGIYQHELKWAPNLNVRPNLQISTPTEKRNPTLKYKTQLVDKIQSINKFATYLFCSPCMYATRLHYNMYMYVSFPLSAHVHLQKTRESILLHLWNFSASVTSTNNLSLHPTNHFPTCTITTTNKSIPFNNLCMFLMHTPSHYTDIPQPYKNKTIQPTSCHLPYPNIITTIQRIPQAFTTRWVNLSIKKTYNHTITSVADLNL